MASGHDTHQQRSLQDRQRLRRAREHSDGQAWLTTSSSFQTSTPITVPASTSPPPVPTLRRRQADPNTQFPNPHPPTTTPTTTLLPYRPQRSSVPDHSQHSIVTPQTALRRKSPFYAAHMPPPTPPLATPAPAARASASHPLSSRQTDRFADTTKTPQPQTTDNAEDGDEDEDEDDQDVRWSSDESTPTPTASSVRAASVRRREEAKSMRPVALLAPEQHAQRQFVTSMASPSYKQREAPSTSRFILPQPEAQSSGTKVDVKGKGVAGKRPASSQSITLPDGQEVPLIRTDFENMKRVARPVSSSVGQDDQADAKANVTQSLTLPLQSSSSSTAMIRSPLSASVPLGKTPVLQYTAQFRSDAAEQRPRSSEATQAILQDFQPHRITPVQEEESDQSPSSPPGQQQTSHHAQASDLRRHSQTASVRRSSMDSTSTALDTPQLDGNANDGREIFFEMIEGGGGGGGRRAEAAAIVDDMQARQRILSNEPSRNNVGKGIEPPRSNASSFARQGTPRGINLSSHMEQLQRFIYSTASSGSARSVPPTTGRGATKPETTAVVASQQPHGILAAAAAAAAAAREPARPLTGNSARQRPGTGQTRVSFDDAAPPTRNHGRRRLGSSGSGNENRLRIFGNNKDMLRFFQQRDATSPTGGGGRKREQASKHTHDKPACRQCFRAGFDCAIQLQTGHGTGARKALQEFVTAGGLDALSGVEDFYEGSVWASQAAHPRQSSSGIEADEFPPVTGQNFVDRLGEVAFGESALSRPVTRGAVQGMLEERGRVLAERQHSKTVEDFLAELQRLQKQQEIEDGLRVEHGNDAAHDAPTDDSQGTKALQHSPALRSSQHRVSDARRSQGDAVAEDEKAADEQTGASATIDGDDDDDNSNGDDDDEDDLPFLADRWSLKRKALQLGICALWIFCVQCVGAGYDTSLYAISRNTGSEPLSLQAGQFAFLAAQSGGLLFAPALGCSGRHRSAPVLVILFAAVSVVIGFIRIGVVLTILRGTLGYLAGAFEGLTIAMILDMSATQTQRLTFFVCMATCVVSAQASAPWIAQLVLAIGSWSWLYWMASVFGISYVLLFAFVARETESCAIYRAQVRRLRIHSRTVWTPEPRPTPTSRQFVLDYALRPYVVLVRHTIVALSTVLLAVTLGAVIAVLGPFGDVLLSQHNFESWKVSLLISVCVAIGCIGGAVVMLFFAAGAGRRGRRHNGELSGDKAERMRALFMDESGVIDAQRPAFDAEAILMHCVLAGFIASIVGLFALALTATTTSWIFSAVSLCVVVTGTMMLVAGLLYYLSEAYFPAHRATLREVLAEEQDHSHSHDNDNDNERHSDDQQSIQDDHSLMSGADEKGTRWSSSWALSVVSTTLAGGLCVGGAMTIAGQIASKRIGFTVFAAIAASVVLAVAGLAMCVLIRMGARFRHRAFTHIARSEAASAAKAAAAAATASDSHPSTSTSTNDGTSQSPRHSQNGIRAFILKPGKAKRNDVEKQSNVSLQPRSRRWLPWRQQRSRRSNSNSNSNHHPRLSISAPFDVQHVASGGGELPSSFANAGWEVEADAAAAAAANVVAQRRQTLVNPDAYDAAAVQKKKDADDDEQAVVHPAAARRPMRVTSERRSSLPPDVPFPKRQSPPDNQTNPYANPAGGTANYRGTLNQTTMIPSSNLPARPPPAAVASSPRALQAVEPEQQRRGFSTIRAVPRKSVPSTNDGDNDHSDAVNAHHAAQQAQMIWSVSHPRTRQSTMRDGVLMSAVQE